MQFRISDTFTDSLGKLTGDEQKAVKTTAFDLQMNPASPGMQFHKLGKARDPNFWSVRVNSDVRIIVHKTSDNLLLCYVDHHDKAYAWAERRKLQTHPKTGAAQLVTIREKVKEITVPRYVEVEQPAPPKPPLFADIPDDDLLGYGVPLDWLEDVHQATEETLFDIAEHLPSEAAEALLDLATGVTPQPAVVQVPVVSPFEHPDAQRRFRLMTNVEELRQALEAPWEKWAVFLHPVQRDLVERDYNGPARVAGSAGTGKTVVAIHRAAYLARRHPQARLLLTTFSEPLASALRTKLHLLVGQEPDVGQRITVTPLPSVARRLYAEQHGQANLVEEATLREFLKTASEQVGPHKFSEAFLWTEWSEVVDAWQLDSWEAYRDVQRLGRKTRLGEQQRQTLWEIFSRVRQQLDEQNLLTGPSLLARVTEHVDGLEMPPFDFVIVDEAQDVSVPELRFLAVLGRHDSDSLFFAGDLGQRIFQTPFSWKSLGVDVRGRSKTLRINYRTSHQIRLQADRLLPPEVSDVDGISESRRGTLSAFDGPEPIVQVYDSIEAETAAAAQWLKARIAEGITPSEIAVFVRSADQIDRARESISAAGLKPLVLDERIAACEDHVAILTMHLAKGLEFRAVLVLACDDDVLPLQFRIETVADDADLEEVYNTERHLLYVASTRARDHLMVSGQSPGSEFLEDLAP